MNPSPPNAPPEFDVVIVGAGAAGSLLAYELAHSQSPKVSVLILEAGPEYDSIENRVDALYAAAAKVPSAPWPEVPQARRPSVLDISSTETWQADDKYMRQQGPLPFSSTYERYTGGTANHWMGTALRLLPEDFKLASGLGVEGARDWPLDYSDLEPFYDDAEKKIGVSGNTAEWQAIYPKGFAGFPMQEISQSYLDQQFKANVDGKTINNQKIEVTSTPQARNRTWYQGRPPCVGNNSCTPLCPIRAKYDPSHHLKSALGQTQEPTYPREPNGQAQYPAPASNPAKIRYQSVAYQLDVDERGQISGVRYRNWDGTEGVATARRYVLCAHAIETAKLLLNSPWTPPGRKPTTVANTSGEVGLNLMDHTILLMWALTNDPVYPYRGSISTSGIGNFRFGAERQKRAAYIIEIGNDGWRWPEVAPLTTVYDLIKEGEPTGAWFGTKLLNKLRDKCTRQVRMAAEFEALPSRDSRVELSKTHTDKLGIPQPEIHYQVSEYTQRGFDDALQTLTGIFKELGTSEIHYEPQPDSKSPGIFTSPAGHRFELRGAGHIIGTHRMGCKPDDSVVDSECRSWDHSNLFLVGAGVFPSTATANPTLTVFALALRAAKKILDDLKAQVP